MNPTESKYDELIAQNEDLKSRLSEAEEVIHAIRNGEVDAVVVNKGNDPQLYSLKSADHTYRVFIEKMNDGAVTLSDKGYILYCNSSFAKMLDMGMDKILGTSFEDLVPAQYKEKVGELIQKAWKQDCKAEITLNGKIKPLPVLLSLNSMEIDGGDSVSIVISDLSFQKEAQEQKKAIEQKDEFISIASHELKTPVTSIKGYIQLLRYDFQKEGNAKADSMLAKADAQVNKLSLLINELLDVKKIETGQLQFHEEHFDLNELVDEITEESSRMLNRHRVNCTHIGKCRVYGDRNKIGQVITNLLDNATKYSAADTNINICVIAKNDKARCSVQDQGMGIPRDQLGKVFERFYRVSGESENTYAGLGLGLYISSEIIKRHKGNMGVESDEGKGSTFYFELPLN